MMLTLLPGDESTTWNDDMVPRRVTSWVCEEIEAGNRDDGPRICVAKYLRLHIYIYKIKNKLISKAHMHL